MSAAAKKIMGMYVAEGAAPAQPTIRWFQEELRSGQFRPALDEFARNQPEELDAGVCRVDEINASGVTGRIPCYAYDHESRHPFSTEVGFRLDPLNGNVSRLS
jgi:hypothetical protein